MKLQNLLSLDIDCHYSIFIKNKVIEHFPHKSTVFLVEDNCLVNTISTEFVNLTIFLASMKVLRLLLS